MVQIIEINSNNCTRINIFYPNNNLFTGAAIFC